jgi:hypothetical protein
MMQINWVFQSEYCIDPTWDPNAMKSVGPFWGSWRTWRSCATDNVICHDFAKAQELVHRGFQTQCNFHVPNRHFAALGRPTDLILYDGDFEREIDDIEDIVACHLASAQSEIVLLLGFDLTQPNDTLDRLQNHKNQNRLALLHGVMRSSDPVQWVAVDHPGSLEDRFRNLTNLTCDTIENVLKLLDQ